MTPTEVLRKVHSGEISMDTVNKCKDVAAYYSDPETGKHFIGFVDPKTGPEQLEVKKEEFETLVSVGRVMSRFTSVRKTPNGMNGLLKILSLIDTQKAGFGSDSDLRMN